MWFNYKSAICTLGVVLVLLLMNTATILAQCPMCKAVGESNLKEGGTAGVGLNNGIIYLFLAPYIIVAVIGYFWWRNNRKVEKAEQQQLTRQQQVLSFQEEQQRLYN